MIRPFVSGDALEERLRAKLEGSCTVQYDPVFDHDYKIDLAVTNFKAIRRFTDQIGIQVTANQDDATKQAEFLRISRAHADVIPRRIYLEVDSTADLDGVAVVLYAALISLIFDKAHADNRLTGLRIGKSLSFEFFDLDANLERLRQRSPLPTASLLEGELQGRLFKYFQKGFGFIERSGQEYWFHISQVEPTLRERLEGEKRTSEATVIDLSVPVTFREGRRPGRNEPVALDIKPISQE